MNHLQLPAELGIVILEAIEAVRTVRDYLLNLMLFKGCNVRLSEFLEQELIAHATGTLTCTPFFRAQNSKIDLGCL